MNKVIPAIVGGAMFLSACSAETASHTLPTTNKGAAIQPAIATVPAFGQVEFEASFPQADQHIVRDMANVYVTAYGCAQTVVRVAVEVMPAPETSTDGSIVTTRATSTPGRVVFNQSGFPQTTDDLGNITIHEFTHACQESQPKLFAKPVRLPDGAVARGAQGFNLLVTLPTGEETEFHLIEEGTAEALASKAKQDYTVQDKRYFALGKLTRKLQEQASITSLELARMQHNDDLEQFVQRNSPAGQPFEANLPFVVSEYQQAYNS